MDIGWQQVFTIVGANLALIIVSISITLTLFLWVRKEANVDRQQHQQDLKEFRNRWETESKEFRERWAAESKDFHSRLLLIEERNKKC